MASVALMSVSSCSLSLTTRLLPAVLALSWRSKVKVLREAKEEDRLRASSDGKPRATRRSARRSAGKL